MNGRMEHEVKVSKYIDERIRDYPNYVKRYNKNMYGSGKTHNTRKSYISVLLRYLDYLKANGYDINDIGIFKNIKATEIEDYFSEIRKEQTYRTGHDYSGSYINMQKMALGNFYTYLVKDRAIDANTFAEVEISKKKDEHSQVALDIKEVDIMYDNIKNGVGNKIAKGKQKKWKERDMAIIDLALNSGLRVSALTEINIEDINFDEMTVHVIEKGEKSRAVSIDEECAGEIKAWLEKREGLLGDGKTNALFISNRRERLTQDGVAKIVKKYSSGINKKVSPHKLRSTFATNAYQATKDIEGVSRALGHSNIAITQRYLADGKDKEREIINAVRQRYKNQY